MGRSQAVGAFAETGWKILDQLHLRAPSLSWTICRTSWDRQRSVDTTILASVGPRSRVVVDERRVRIGDSDGHVFASLVARSSDAEISPALDGEMALYGRLLESVLTEQMSELKARHDAVVDRDRVNGFDSAAAWLERIAILDEQCRGLGDQATAAVIELVGIDRVRSNFGHLVAEERIRDLSFRVRSMCDCETYLGMVGHDRVGVVRIGSSAADSRLWLSRVCHPSIAAVEVCITACSGSQSRSATLQSVFAGVAHGSARQSPVLSRNRLLAAVR